MFDVNGSSLADLSFNPYDIDDSKDMKYNDCFDPDTNFLNLRMVYANTTMQWSLIHSLVVYENKVKKYFSQHSTLTYNT